VRDEVYNALERPRAEVVLATLFPDGVVALRRRGPAAAQHTLAQTAAQLRRVQHPMLDESRRASWAAALDDAGTPLAPLVAAHAAARSDAHRAHATRASLARAAWLELPSLKRELRAAGLTEVQVHSVIPDSPRSRRARGNGHDTSATALAPAATPPAALPPSTAGEGAGGASGQSSG
jgi:hypothetical protein